MKLVYLAPEIPALSATFVYNELLAVEALGYEIIPVSVHKPAHEACESKLESLRKRVVYLYATPKLEIVKKHIKILFFHPANYVKTFFQCFTDILSVGLFKRNALGLVYRFFYAVGLADLLMREKVEHVHVHFVHVPADIAMYASKIAGITYSAMAHANDIFERGLLIKQKVDRSLFLATISEFNREYIYSTYQVDKNKLPIIRCGVDASIFAEKQYKDIQSPVKLGVVGRLVEKKGLDTLVEAAEILKQSNMDFVIDIAGSGPLEQELNSLVERLALTNMIRFLGAITHDEVADFVRGLDIFVLPCKRDTQGDMDGIPVVLMEAMMVGTPVISSKLSGIPELVVDNQTGLLIEAGNAQQLASRILQLLKDKQLQKRLTRQAIIKVQQEFGQDVNAKRLEQLFLKH